MNTKEQRMKEDKIADRAANILRHIQRVGPVTVFKIGDTFRTCRADGELARLSMGHWEAAMEKKLKMVGVYDNRCKEEWLVEDMTYMVDLK